MSMERRWRRAARRHPPCGITVSSCWLLKSSRLLAQPWSLCPPPPGLAFAEHSSVLFPSRSRRVVIPWPGGSGVCSAGPGALGLPGGLLFFSWTPSSMPGTSLICRPSVCEPDKCWRWGELSESLPGARRAGLGEGAGRIPLTVRFCSSCPSWQVPGWPAAGVPPEGAPPCHLLPPVAVARPAQPPRAARHGAV